MANKNHPNAWRNLGLSFCIWSSWVIFIKMEAPIELVLMELERHFLKFYIIHLFLFLFGRQILQREGDREVCHLMVRAINDHNSRSWSDLIWSWESGVFMGVLRWCSFLCWLPRSLAGSSIGCAAAGTWTGSLSGRGLTGYAMSLASAQKIFSSVKSNFSNFVLLFDVLLILFLRDWCQFLVLGNLPYVF